MIFFLHTIYAYITPCYGVFFFCVPSFISGDHHSSSSSALPAISLEFIILLLLYSLLDLWGSPFFFSFFCIHQLYLWGSLCLLLLLHFLLHSPAISLGFTLSSSSSSFSSAFTSYISGVHFVFFFFFIFFCIHQLYLWGSLCLLLLLHFLLHSPAISLGFTLSSSLSSAFPALSVRFTILLLFLLRSPAIYLGFTILGEIFAYVTVFFFNPTIEVVTFRLRGFCMLCVFVAGIHPSRT